MINKVRQISATIIILVLLFSCSSCAKPTEQEQINNTLKKALLAINVKDYAALQKLIEGPSLNTDTFYVVSNTVDAKYFIDKYHEGIIEKLSITTNDSLDVLGRKKYNIELCEGFDSLTGLSNVILVLYVGPPNIIPLTKLSGFEISSNVDADYRGILIEKGRLFDFNPIYHEEYYKYIGRK